jgi:hypothetical protein
MIASRLLAAGTEVELQVAEVYLQDERAYRGDACRTCGYRLPASHFNRCPLCGGAVNYRTS